MIFLVVHAVRCSFFHLYDSDHNEQLTPQELEKFLRLVVTDEMQRLEAVKTMMKDLDGDGNNRINEQEFLNGLQTLLANNSSADNTAAAQTSTVEDDQQASVTINSYNIYVDAWRTDHLKLTWFLKDRRHAYILC